MTEQPQYTAEQLGLDPSSEPEAVERILSVLNAPPPPEPQEWPHGSGTEDDPYVMPPGMTLETTYEEAMAINEAARNGGQS